MTTEIKLPPLPELGEYITIWERILEWDNEPKAGTRALALSDKVDDEITATLQAYATAAIKAYRAQRGEPVAWIVFAEVAGEMIPQHPSRPTLESAESDARMYAVKTEVRPLYTAPQPERKPMMDEKKEELAGAWFAEDWAKKSAIGMLDDYEKFNGIKP